MLSRKTTVLSLLLLVICVISVNAQVSANATATATIISPLTMTWQADINFGNISVGATDGTVVIPAVPVPVRVPSGGVSLPITNPGIVSAAKFGVSGANLNTYAITLPTSVTLTHTASGATMIANNFTTDQPGNIGTITAPVSNVFHVGATLNVNANQAAGVYTSALFPITINYN